MDASPFTSTITPTTTTSSAASTFTGNASYPVFPNAAYISRFYQVPSYESGITNLDTDLYNECYLPYNPLSYLPSSPSNSSSSQNKRDTSWLSITITNPDYDVDLAPCKRQAAINTNCYFQNTNGSISGLQVYAGDFAEQQSCFCEKYPFWESVVGCQKCFELHGGIEGYHWFPESYISAFADSYCGGGTPTQEFYEAYASWKLTAQEVPSTTASDALGTQTEASLYYTATEEAASGKTSGAGLESNRLGWRTLVLVCGIVTNLVVCT